MSSDPGDDFISDLNPGYTNFAEVVHILYDPKIVDYLDLVKHFFTFHDPTIVYDYFKTPMKNGGRFKRNSIIYTHSDK